MISRQEAGEIAAEWSRRDTLRLSYQCSPEVDEFDVGYVVWSRMPLDVPVEFGDGPMTVIDKETGDTCSWPRVPAELVREKYREVRAGLLGRSRTVDPAAQLLRGVRRAPTPGAAAHLTVQHDLHIALGAKGDLTVRHHPLVRAYLDALPPGQLVRGGDRHAELVVLSDVLHGYDHRETAAGRPALTQKTARDLLGSCRLELFRVREPEDPFGGVADHPCESCVRALVHFGVLPWSDLAFAEEWRPEPVPEPEPDQQPAPQPGRFPDEVGQALANAGWRPHFGDDLLARNAVAAVCATGGQTHRHQSFPAAQQSLTAFPGLVSGRRGPGERVWIRRFEINPRAVAHTADSLADLGALLGVRLFPIGHESGDSVIAIDEHGRVFALDQAGEWFLGADLDTALTNLLLGHAADRIADDGTW